MSAPAPAQGVDGGVEQPRAVAGPPGLRVHAEGRAARPCGGEASGSWLGPIAAKPTTCSPAQATSSRCTAGWVASPARPPDLGEGGRLESVERPRRDSTPAYASRHTAACTRPTAGASVSRRQAHAGVGDRTRRPTRRGAWCARGAVVRVLVVVRTSPSSHRPSVCDTAAAVLQRTCNTRHTGGHVRQRLRRPGRAAQRRRDRCVERPRRRPLERGRVRPRSTT